jgi:hypothetical protein
MCYLVSAETQAPQENRGRIPPSSIDPRAQEIFASGCFRAAFGLLTAAAGARSQVAAAPGVGLAAHRAAAFAPIFTRLIALGHGLCEISLVCPAALILRSTRLLERDGDRLAAALDLAALPGSPASEPAVLELVHDLTGGLSLAW